MMEKLRICESGIVAPLGAASFAVELGKTGVSVVMAH
jgi:hypothetical protein